ncbi:hypothetical protein [Streptomyces sp. NPDC001642]|uniref:hypothetical protein n=1 Tax=Streptomyces sp. NPDC001642 TaxID=3154392 RepID=UPI00332B7FD2
MSSPTTRATAIASMLTTALGAPQDKNDTHAVRIEPTESALRISAPVPATLSAAATRDVLDFLLSVADRFGHDVPHDGPSVIWAEIEATDPGGATP